MDITKLQVELNPIDKEVFNVQFRDIETGKVVLELNKAKVNVGLEHKVTLPKGEIK